MPCCSAQQSTSHTPRSPCRQPPSRLPTPWSIAHTRRVCCRPPRTHVPSSPPPSLAHTCPHERTSELAHALGVGAAGKRRLRGPGCPYPTVRAAALQAGPVAHAWRGSVRASPSSRRAADTSRRRPRRRPHRWSCDAWPTPPPPTPSTRAGRGARTAVQCTARALVSREDRARWWHPRQGASWPKPSKAQVGKMSRARTAPGAASTAPQVTPRLLAAQRRVARRPAGEEGYHDGSPLPPRGPTARAAGRVEPPGRPPPDTRCPLLPASCLSLSTPAL